MPVSIRSLIGFFSFRVRKIKYNTKSYTYQFLLCAKVFPALWHLAEGLFLFINYFYYKEGFLRLLSNT
ncbi:hypothetical protein CVT91_10775 [Candidatus Atribacteria bacterium HGW-Atribacteria-1]|nr:MAG: hypothetical protein CVT91_10775 [Candidatus Atribacteria bacterium HGW-Atribacteria-1]